MWNDHKEAISDEYPTHKLVIFQLPLNLNHIGYHIIISQPLSHGHQSELNKKQAILGCLIIIIPLNTNLVHIPGLIAIF